MVRKHTKRRGTATLLFAIVAVLFLLFLDRQGVLDGPKAAAARVLAPVERVLHGGSSSVTGSFRKLATMWDAEERAAALERRVSELEAKLLKERDVVEENNKLRAIANLTAAKPPKGVLGRVIGVNPAVSNTLLLDVGSEEGIRAGVPVVVGDADGNALVGYIERVERRTSQLLLVTDPSSVVEALIPETGARGVLQGMLGGQDAVRLKDVQQDRPLAPGMAVFAVGHAQYHHSPLVIGTVQDVPQDDKATTQSATVRLVARTKGLDRVIVIIE